MLDVLADNPVLTLFLVVGLGSALGLLPFGPIRFGPAGALFVGLAGTIGLALFVCTVGLSSGSILIRTFRRQLPLLAGSALGLLVVGVGTVALGRLLGLSGAFQGGAFARVGTSTPTLAAATAAAGGGTEPAVGYALTYPLGVVLGSGVGGRRRPDRPDDRGRAGARLAEVPGRPRRRCASRSGAAPGRWRWPAPRPWSSRATTWSWSGPRSRWPGRSAGWGRGPTSTWPTTAARSTTAGCWCPTPAWPGPPWPSWTSAAASAGW